MAEPAGKRSRRRERVIRLGAFSLATVGAMAGIAVAWMHVTSDPLADARAYYEAGARLNAGLPLYPAGADPDAAAFYRYPPLLAIAFRPLALLPYPVAAAAWMAVVVASLVATLWHLGLRRRRTWLAVGMLGVPIGWSLTIAQAQVPLTLLTALGAPWSIAVAANLKLFPALVAVWWLGRRDGRGLAAFAGWMVALALLQLVVAPQASMDFLGTLTLEQVGQVRSFSPFAVSPILWAVLLAAAVLVTLRLAPTRWGWAAAVALSVLATPRLLTYMLMTLLAGLREPDRAMPGRSM